MSLFRSIINISVTLTCTVLVNISSWAQDSEEEVIDRWFQVEVILYAQAEEHANEEIWRQDIALAYPPNWVALKSIEDELAERALKAEADELELKTSSIEEQAKSKEASADDLDQPAEESETALDLSQQAFFLLDDQERTLNDTRSSLNWNPNYRVLFHEAWRQPIYDAEKAQAILISAGKKFGEQFELEGSFTLRVSRYLHLETNLWMTKFKHNFGQKSDQWPQLPERPDQRDYVSEHNFLDESNSQDSPWNNFKPANDEYENILNQPYIAERISLLKQTRRMRSNETHLIDHPVVGMIIKLTPYEQPTEEELDEIQNGEVSSEPQEPSI